MKIHITHIANNNFILKSDLDFVNKIIKKYSKKVEVLLPFKLENFTFTVYAWKKDGISAFTQAIDWVEIKINFRQLIIGDTPNKKLLNQLIYIIYHEMHHACREYVGILPKNKEHILIDSIVSEGLADHFAIEQYPVKDILETKNYKFSEISMWIKKLGKVMWNKEGVDDSWLYGGEKKPKMLGYKIGRYIIQKVKEKNLKLNSVNLVHINCKDILALSEINF